MTLHVFNIVRGKSLMLNKRIKRGDPQL